MSIFGREDDFDEEIDEAAAAAQKESFANLRSWTSWGSIKRDPKQRTQRKGNEDMSEFSGQWMGSDAPCVIKAEYPVYNWGEADRLDRLFIYGDEQTRMKFEIAGGKFSLDFAV